mgnify:CR=1 FL=1
MHDFVSVAETAARAGGSQLVQWMGKFDVREKGPADFVTQADLASQKAIKDILSQAFPQHGFIGEEEPLARETQPAYCWIVDPLDGTMNYVHQMRHFCVSIALEKDGELLAGVIFDPLSGECFRAARGEGAHLDGRRLQVRSTERLEDSLVAVSFIALCTGLILSRIRVRPGRSAARSSDVRQALNTNQDVKKAWRICPCFIDTKI